MNVALGLDTFVVQRHGLAAQGADRLGCYFCNDVSGPRDSSRDRTLDQQCTVSRPGLAPVASALAVELLVALLHHPRRAAAPADAARPLADRVDRADRPLGLLPHSVRGFLTHYDTVLPATPAFRHCVACSPPVVAAYRDRGLAFVRDVADDPAVLERVAGVADLCAAADDWDGGGAESGDDF